MIPNEVDLDSESVVCASLDRRFEVRAPAYPSPCDYVRVVHWPAGAGLDRECFECVCWSADELASEQDLDEPDFDVLATMMGAIKRVYDGTFDERTEKWNIRA